VLANGFILTALIWSTLLVFVIERRFKVAAVFAGLGSAFSVVGLIHSPFEDGRLFLPGGSDSDLPGAFAAAYLLVALLLAILPEPPAQAPADASADPPAA
jgi:AGZA family xanthine/uracil permease-like MFS transporter